MRRGEGWRGGRGKVDKERKKDITRRKFIGYISIVLFNRTFMPETFLPTCRESSR